MNFVLPPHLSTAGNTIARQKASATIWSFIPVQWNALSMSNCNALKLVPPLPPLSAVPSHLREMHNHWQQFTAAINNTAVPLRPLSGVPSQCRLSFLLCHQGPAESTQRTSSQCTQCTKSESKCSKKTRLRWIRNALCTQDVSQSTKAQIWNALMHTTA